MEAIGELTGIVPEDLMADPMYEGLLNQLTGTVAANALLMEKILQLLEQNPAKRGLAVALLEFLELEKDLNSFGLSVKDVFDQHSNPYRILGEEEYLRTYQEKYQLVRNIRFKLDKMERMRDYLEQKQKESGSPLVRNGKEWTRQDLAYYRMVEILSGRQPMGTKEQMMKGDLQEIRKRMLKDSELLYDPSYKRKNLKIQFTVYF